MSIWIRMIADEDRSCYNDEKINERSEPDETRERGDLDGLVSAVLIAIMEPVNALELIHPQDIADGKFGRGHYGPAEAILLGFTIPPPARGSASTLVCSRSWWNCSRPDTDTVLATPEIARRIVLCRKNDLRTIKIVQDHSRTDGNVIIAYLRS